MHHACTTRAPRHLILHKGKGREGKGTNNTASTDAGEIYALYPRKEGRADAIKAIEKAMRKTTVEVLKEAVSAFAKAKEGQETKFIPHPATWFNGERWLDDRNTWIANKQMPFATLVQPKNPLDPETIARRTPMKDL